MRNKILISGLLAATVFATTGALAIDQSRVAEVEASPEAVLSILATNQDENMESPTIISLEDLPLDASSIRHFQQTKDANFWIAEDTEGLVCLLMEINEPKGNSPSLGAVGCNTVEYFYENSITLRLISGDGFGRLAHVLPAYITAQDVSQAFDNLDAKYKDDVEVFEVEGNLLVTMTTSIAAKIGDIKIDSKSHGETILQTIK